jgi:4-hydroxybutyryl-CoA dehydratase/vinylacetyl-CoA-Delta-isomerase
MIHLNETLWCCAVACSALGKPMAAGNYMVDLLLANVSKQNVTRFPYEIARLAEDIAGGLMVTMPAEQDLRHREIGHYVKKYLQGAVGKDTENRMRVLRLVENITLGTAAVGYRTESMHGAGSPQAQRIMISRQGNLEAKKEMARKIAKVDTGKDKS